MSALVKASEDLVSGSLSIRGAENPLMTYKSMVRNVDGSFLTRRTTDNLQNFLDEYLKEGTDQGWTLHKFNISHNSLFGYSVTLIRDTNE
ncbi:MAG: hypothetical protein ACJ05G_11845 [Actinomycetota bacterium]|jgi:hypothetical protein|nr:hypothetical protein [Acidimicrobiales bacterium]